MAKGWIYKPAEWNIIMEKTCKYCGEQKPLTAFYRNPKGRFGVRAACIPCEEYKRKHSYKQTSKEDQNSYATKYREANYNVCLERTKEWRKNNLAYDAFRSKVYRTRKQNQLPSWANLEVIKQMYLACPKGFHVDHIIPLKGTHACGLHVESNLQYLLAKDNLKKRNLYGWNEL